MYDFAEKNRVCGNFTMLCRKIYLVEIFAECAEIFYKICLISYNRLRLSTENIFTKFKREFFRLSKKQKRRANQSLHYTVKEPTTLLPFLLEVMPNRGRNSVKSILKRGQVSVDDHMETKYNYELYAGQTVSILPNKVARSEGGLIGLEIIYEDEDVIVVNKEAGLLTIATKKEKHRTAHYQLMQYAREKNPRNRVFIVHRLDQDTSGVMLFAKNEQTKKKLQDGWHSNVKERSYLALVEGKFEKESGIFTSWLKETKTHRMYSSDKENDGLFAKTEFKVVRANNDFSLVEVHLHTGRKNQIRVHMQDLGHPVVGDKKYGAKTNDIRRLGLHAQKLSFIHPKTNELLTFTVDAPKVFWTKLK